MNKISEKDKFGSNKRTKHRKNYEGIKKTIEKKDPIDKSKTSKNQSEIVACEQ